MAETSRPRRTDCARTGPERNPLGHGDAGAEGMRAVITDAVRLAYEVAEEQIRWGREAAEKFSGAGYSAADLQHDLVQAVERTALVSRDLGLKWTEIVLAGLEMMSAARGTGAPAKSKPCQTAKAEPVAHPVRGHRVSKASIRLLPTRKPIVPVVHALHAVPKPGETAGPALHGVRFARDAEHGTAHVHVDVPQGHPGGHYAGEIVDHDSGQRIGTLYIEVEELPRHSGGADHT